MSAGAEPGEGGEAVRAGGAGAADLHVVLAETFGLQAFRAGQEAVVRSLLEGQSALAVFPTGAGKSLCFQLAALLLDGLTLVVSPLLALMREQVDKLQARGVAAARLDSTLADDEVDEVLGQLAGGALKLLYVSPERLASAAFRGHLRGVRVALLAVDEAHCISEWGHNFRPDYLRLAKLARALRVGRVLALTATATVPVVASIRRGFRIPAGGVFLADPARPNLRLGVTACAAAEKDGVLLRLLEEMVGPVIVYATGRHDTERIATMLQRCGQAARAYHAGLPAETRADAQRRFMDGELRVVVATIAFGMGIDKPDIRGVIHYHLPKCLEGYSQETGRAGRDGLPSRCELLADAADTLALANFIHGSTPAPQALRNLLDRLLRMAPPGRDFAVSIHELATTHDLREETVRTVIACLELDGVIERRGAFHDYLRVRQVRPTERILAGMEAREKPRVRKVLAAGTPYRGSLVYRLRETAERSGMSAERIAGVLRELALAGDLHLEERGLREVYRMSRDWRGDIQGTTERLAGQFARRAAFEHGRIDAVLRFVGTRDCRAVHLARYFGHRQRAACGHCDRCEGAAPVRLAAHRPPPVGEDAWVAMRALRDLRHPALATPPQLARFLCGISSPAATRARLNAREEFGLWAGHPYENVLQWVSA